MKLHLIPCLPADPMLSAVPENPPATVAGDVLTFDGHDLDFGPLPAGASLPATAIAHPAILGAARDAAGALTVQIRFAIPNCASEHMRFPAPIDIEAGPVQWPQEPPKPEPTMLLQEPTHD